MITPSPVPESVHDRLQAWTRGRFLARAHARDATLWFDPPRAETADRLGWIDLPYASQRQVPEWAAFADEVRDAGIQDVVLFGMGGSSLAPEAYQRTFGNAPGRPRLTVFDTTHPDALAGLDARTDPHSTLYVVSSKSGTTVETTSAFQHAWKRAGDTLDRPGEHFAAITDPGSPLSAEAQRFGFRRVFHAPLDVGGRFSALSAFGLVPAALIGADVDRLLSRAQAQAARHAAEAAVEEAPGLQLGASLAEFASTGRNQVALLASDHLAAFPDWAEQLVAESLGKEGRGIVPVLEDAMRAPRDYRETDALVTLQVEGETGPDPRRVGEIERTGAPVIRRTLQDAYDLGGEMYVWEWAVAAAGAALELHPFDQPDVQLAKSLARRALDGGGRGGWKDAPATAWVRLERKEEAEWAVRAWVEEHLPADYAAIQAYTPASPAMDDALRELRAAVHSAVGGAVTIGYGPRFLHSTGQLHKGGPPNVHVLQLVDQPTRDAPIPGSTHTFGQLLRAQAQGDLAALRQRGRRVLPIDVGPSSPARVMELAELVRRTRRG